MLLTAIDDGSSPREFERNSAFWIMIKSVNLTI
jgi:hypothetical protein